MSHLFCEAPFASACKLYSQIKLNAAELMNVSGLQDLNEEKVEELVYLLVFVWSPRSERWPRQDRQKKYDKNSKNFMHWNVAPDTLPGSATIGPLA